MVGMLLVDHAGATHRIEAPTDRPLMEVIRDAGFDEMLALCGGGCACATCHVYVDEAFLDRLPAITEDENDLLDSSEHRRPNSRLSCQIKAEADLEGATITLVAE